MEPYIGEIRMFAGTFAPKGWLLCDGASYSPASFSSLYSLITEIYGGDGQSFKVPDLRGRAPVQWGQGAGLSPYSIGQPAGKESVTLTVPQLPAHSHTLNAKVTGDQHTPVNNYIGGLIDSTSQNPLNMWGETTDAVMNPGAIGLTGGSLPVNIVSPILAVTYIIAYEGIYPSRP